MRKDPVYAQHTAENNTQLFVSKCARPMLLSFSGLDGAGKSTQIESLCLWRRSKNLHVDVLRFWDEVASFTWLRETLGHLIFGGDRGVGAAKRPIQRRDKNVDSVGITAIRLFVYLLDAVMLRMAVINARRSSADIVVFDRYIYDEFANLNTDYRYIRCYIQMVMAFVPKPDISFYLDVEPEAAFARKPEYPLSFLYKNRNSFLLLAELTGGMTVIPPMSTAEVERAIHQTLVQKCERNMK